MKDLFPQNTASYQGPETLKNEGLGHPTRLRTPIIKGTKGRRILAELDFEYQWRPEDEFQKQRKED